jgi:hypothetical protein
MVELHDKPTLTLFSPIVYDEYSLPNKNNRERGNFVINIARLNLHVNDALLKIGVLNNTPWCVI